MFSPLGDADDTVLEQEEMDLERQLLEIRAKRQEVKRKLQERSYIIKREEFNSRYGGWALKKMLHLVLGRRAPRITTSAEAIEELYGIRFDVDKLNRQLEDLEVDYGLLDLPEEDLIKRYNVVKTRIGTKVHEFVPDKYEDILMKEVGSR